MKFMNIKSRLRKIGYNIIEPFLSSHAVGNISFIYFVIAWRIIYHLIVFIFGISNSDIFGDARAVVVSMFMSLFWLVCFISIVDDYYLARHKVKPIFIESKGRDKGFFGPRITYRNVFCLFVFVHLWFLRCILKFFLKKEGKS